MALTTLASVKEMLGITHTREDAKLTTFIAQASAVIVQHIGRNLEQATYTEYTQGEDTRLLLMRQYPIISVTSIHLDNNGFFGVPSGAFPASTLLVQGTDYAIYKDDGNTGGSGIIIRINDVWPKMPARKAGQVTSYRIPQDGNLKVVYVAGYSTIPDDIALAANLIVAELRRTAPYGGYGVVSESLNKYQYSLGQIGNQSSLTQIKALLKHYKKPSIGG